MIRFWPDSPAFTNYLNKDQMEGSKVIKNDHDKGNKNASKVEPMFDFRSKLERFFSLK